VQHTILLSSRKAKLVNPRSGVAAVAVALALLLAGCSGSDGTPGQGAADDGSPDVAPASPAPSSSPSETDGVPAVAPASGAELAVDGVRLRAPLAFSGLPDQFKLRQAAYVPWSESHVAVTRFPNMAGFTLDESARGTLREGRFPRGRRLDDRVIDDQPVFHLVGRLERGGYGEQFGTVLGDDELSVVFEFRKDEPAAYRDEVIASVLQTVDFGARSVTLPEPGSIPPPPARGPRLKIPGASLRVPVYWDPTTLPTTTFDLAIPSGGFESVLVVSTEPRGAVSGLDQQARQSMRALGWRGSANRLDDTEIDGRPAVHVAGRVTPDLYTERFVMLVDGQRITVTFDFADDESRAYRNEVVASVVPTIRIAD
jgi:hypothetical protein